MAPLPRLLTQILAGYLAQALTRRLQQSPAFFRIVDRMVHEADHLPLRFQGRPVPPHRPRNPQEPTLREQAQDAWDRQNDDIGEPHDTPDPFRKDTQHAGQKQLYGPDVNANHRPTSSFSRPSAQHKQKTQRRADTNNSKKESAGESKPEGVDELKALLDKLRNKEI